MQKMYNESWQVSKRMEIAGSHHLSLSYGSPCTNIHGHNWIITVYCTATKLNRNGMVVDFSHIKKRIHDYLDHGDLNKLLPNDMNPTAENIAKWICEEVTDLCDNYSYCYRVDVQESDGNIATYKRGEAL